MSIHRRHQRSESGQALVEFALVVPLLVLIVLGIIDFGRIFYTYEALANAAREGARYCALKPGDTPGTRARVAGELGGLVTPIAGETVCQITNNQATVTAAATVTLVTPFMAKIIDPNTSLSCAGRSIMGRLVGCGGTQNITVRAAATMVVWQ
jgi:hypothetical protein